MALSTTLSTVSPAACGANFNVATACSACLPRMRSTTRRAFWGVTRTNRACALASIAVLPSWIVMCRTPCGCRAGLSDGRSATTALAVVLLVAAERPRGGELAQLVPDHRLGDEDGRVLAAVVHRE